MTDKAEPPRTDDQQPIINIVGEKVALGPIRRDLDSSISNMVQRLQSQAIRGAHAAHIARAE